MKQLLTETPVYTPVRVSRKRPNDSSNPAREECNSLIVQASKHIVTVHTVSWFWLPKQSPPAEPEIQELNRLVDTLLSNYRNYFSDLVERESWSESNCLSHFQNIAREVLNEDEENYNWTRIAMLLALACRMAQHCYANGATTSFVTRFSHAVGLFMEQRIHAWVQRDNQWANLRQRERSEPSSGKSLMHLFGVGTTIVSAVLTVLNLTQSSSAIATFLKK